MQTYQPTVTEIEARSILTPQKGGSLAAGYDFSLNPYGGCAFRCSYCYVPRFPSARHEPQDWGRWIEVKTNAAELIRKERARVFGSRIFFSSATDPYQYIELKYRLTRACLRELARYKPSRLTMHTRSHLLLQDLDLLKSFGDTLAVGVSITSDDEEIIRDFEPGAPALVRRLELIRELHSHGIKVFASFAPLLPHNTARLVELVAPYVECAWIDRMHWTEVNNDKTLLARHAAFFQSDNYREQVEKLRKALQVKGVRVRN